MSDSPNPSLGMGLLDPLRRIDEAAKVLAADSLCEWVRCRAGIVGLVRLHERIAPEELRRELASLIAHAHAILDQLPVTVLSQQDLWNLILLIGLPWKRFEAQADSALAGLLQEWTRNTIGSRKLLLWSDETILTHFGPLAELDGSPGNMFTEDPLREELDRLSSTASEREVFELIFKARISEGDITDIINILGGKKAL